MASRSTDWSMTAGYAKGAEADSVKVSAAQARRADAKRGTSAARFNDAMLRIRPRGAVPPVAGHNVRVSNPQCRQRGRAPPGRVQRGRAARGLDVASRLQRGLASQCGVQGSDRSVRNLRVTTSRDNASSPGRQAMGGEMLGSLTDNKATQALR